MTSLAYELRFAMQFELGYAKPRLTTEMRNAADRAGGASDLRLHPRQLTQRDLEGDVGLPVGQPVNIVRL